MVLNPVCYGHLAGTDGRHPQYLPPFTHRRSGAVLPVLRSRHVRLQIPPVLPLAFQVRESAISMMFLQALEVYQ